MWPSCRQRHCVQSGWCKTWESVWRQDRKPILVCEVFFFSTSLQVQCQIFSSKNVSQVRTEKCKTRSFICWENFKFLGWRWYNFCSDCVFLENSGHGFNNIRTRRVKNRFQIVNFWEFWKILVKKHELSLCSFFVPWWVENFWKCNLPLTF